MERIFDGARLRFARMYSGRSLTELANDTGISKQLISQYENNDSKPSYERLATISEILGFPYDFFMQVDRYTPTASATYFRSLMSAGKADRSAQVYRLMMIGELYRALEEYIDFPGLNLPNVSFSGSDSEIDDKIHDHALKEIEGISMKVREYWGLGNAPIGNLQFIMEENGIIVSGYPTGTREIDAFSQRTMVGGSNLFIVAVDQGEKPEARIRFDLAHELAHILIHPWSESLDEVTKEEFKIREKQAQSFASAFLMPRESFGVDVSNYPTDLTYYLFLKKKWNVSVAAMLYRAHELEIITTNQYQYLMRQYSKKGWRNGEPDDEPFYLNENVFQGAIDVLFDSKIFSPVTLMRYFESKGIALYPGQIEELLHLRKGVLDIPDNSKPRLRLRVIDRNSVDETT